MVHQAKFAATVDNAPPWYAGALQYLRADGPEARHGDLADRDAFPVASTWSRLDQAAAASGFGTKQAQCRRTRHGRGDVVGRMDEAGRWSWSGLVVCQRATCPACGSNKARRAVAKLGATIARWQAGGGVVWLATLTLPHDRTNEPSGLVRTMFGAWRTLTADRAFKAWRRFYGVKAIVRVLDATVGGKAGVHPHFHCLVFVRGDVPALPPSWLLEARRAIGLNPLDEAAASIRRTCQEYADGIAVEAELRAAWSRALVAAGLRPGYSCCDVRAGDAAARYVVKWGLADEAAAPVKLRHPVRLLDAAAAAQAAGDDPTPYRAAWLEWSTAVGGLQAIAGVADAMKAIGVTDDDVTAYQAERTEARGPAAASHTPAVVAIPAHLWPVVRRLSWQEIEARLTAAVASGDDPLTCLLRRKGYEPWPTSPVTLPSASAPLSRSTSRPDPAAPS